MCTNCQYISVIILIYWVINWGGLRKDRATYLVKRFAEIAWAWKISILIFEEVKSGIRLSMKSWRQSLMTRMTDSNGFGNSDWTISPHLKWPPASWHCSHFLLGWHKTLGYPTPPLTHPSLVTGSPPPFLFLFFGSSLLPILDHGQFSKNHPCPPLCICLADWWWAFLSSSVVSTAKTY